MWKIQSRLPKPEGAICMSVARSEAAYNSDMLHWMCWLCGLLGTVIMERGSVLLLMVFLSLLSTQGFCYRSLHNKEHVLQLDLVKLAGSSSFTSQEQLSQVLRQDQLRIQEIHAKLHKTDSSLAAAAAAAQESPETPLSSGASLGTGAYFVQLGIGTPSTPVYLVMDTGSDITWLQCAPCISCYFQADPIFVPLNSSSYERISCSSELCQQLMSESSNCQEDDKCSYAVSYLDESSSTGAFSTESFTLGRGEVPIPKKIPFGCGFVNLGLFRGASGLLGMGGGPVSFFSQVAPLFGRKFSYCMVDRYSPAEVSSPLVFGDSAIASSGSEFTPLLFHPGSSTYYFANMTGISLNGELLSIPASTLQMDELGKGGTILDSGTTLTLLAMPAYRALRDAFLAAMGSTVELKEVPGLDVCFVMDGESGQVPSVALHFDGGAKLELPKGNVVIPAGKERTWCLAFVGTELGVSIIGNVQQQTFRIGFDLERGVIAFSSPYSC